jgi:hypothetical protein
MSPILARSTPAFRTLLVAIVVGFSSVFVAPSASAGTYLEHEKVFPNPATQKSMTGKVRTWRQGQMVRREDPLTNGYIILDLEKGIITGISPSDRTYWKVEKKAYQETLVRSLALLGVRPLPGGDIQVPEKLFVPTGKKAEIAGRNAYEVKVQADLPPGQSASYWFSEELPGTMEDMVGEMRAALGHPKGEGYARLFAQWRALKGYPVQQVTVVQTAAGPVLYSETLLTYRTETLRNELFAIPAGYKKVDDPMARLSGAKAKAAKSTIRGIDTPLGP